jgi:hypothetical protein
MIAVRLSLFATALLVAASCGSGDRRDQWYGSDVGVGWGDGAILSRPEAGPEAGPEVASDAPAMTDSAADIASVADAGALADSASIVDAPKDGTD